MKLNYLWILVILLSISCKSSTLEKTTNVHFSKVDLNQESNSEVKYVNDFDLYNDKYLSLHFRLDQPLIQSLRELTPTLSDEELLKNGNFQFSFLVDGKNIYTENLNSGAGTILQKTEEVDKEIRLVTPERIDFWGWFLWKRFLWFRGGQKALTQGEHDLEIEIRPYLKVKTLKVGPVLAKGSVHVKVPEIEVPQNLISIQEIKPTSDWEVSDDDFDREKVESFNRKVAEVKYEGITINSFVVIKNNKLLIEEYFNGTTRDDIHDVRSVGKSFASTMLGIAIDENHIESEAQLITGFYDLSSFENYSPKKDSVTLKSLLTMSSGFLGNDSDYSSPGNEENMYPTDNWVKFALDLPMHTEKRIGKDYTYFTAGVVLLGDIIHQSVPNGLVSYADKKLFSPLNITNYKWQFTPQNVANTAGGIRLRPIDFAKYGQLYKNKGVWNGQRILTEEWVNKSLSKQVSQSYVGRKDWHYGYLFWNKNYSVNGKDYEVSFCTGNGGNKIFIFKDFPFVIIITASAYGMPDAHSTIDEMMVDYIIPALIN